MSTIFDLPAVWREKLMPASFKGMRFHCETNSRESGRRIVEHEFPKKELPYAEDMGRKAREFSVRGYCITYPFDTDISLYNIDYRIARDRLVRALDAEGAGPLQFPTQLWEYVVCSRYRLSEEERFGGYCVFDMTFVEAGIDAQQVAPNIDTKFPLMTSADALRHRTIQLMAQPTQQQIIARDRVTVSP